MKKRKCPADMTVQFAARQTPHLAITRSTSCRNIKGEAVRNAFQTSGVNATSALPVLENCDRLSVRIVSHHP